MNSPRFELRSAVYLMPLKKNKILLARRKNTSWMDGMYSLISGHLDGNETVNTAMIREAFEEANIKIDNHQLIPATVIHRKSTDSEYIDFFYVIREWEGEPSIGEPDKCDDLSWFSLSNLPDNLLPHIKEALNNYNSHTAFSTSGWGNS